MTVALRRRVAFFVVGIVRGARVVLLRRIAGGLLALLGRTASIVGRLFSLLRSNIVVVTCRRAIVIASGGRVVLLKRIAAGLV